jgi:hypothetical protein
MSTLFPHFLRALAVILRAAAGLVVHGLLRPGQPAAVTLQGRVSPR